MQKNKKYWEDIASEYAKIISEVGDPRHEQVVNPAVFELLGNLNDKVVLDAGCGNGYLSRRIAKTAKKVIGVDLTEELIKQAKNQHNPQNVEFMLGNLENLPFDNEVFEVVLTNLVLIDVENLNLVVSELARVLKKGGRLVMSTLHPCFENPPRTYSWWTEDKKIRIGRVVQKYFDTGLIKDDNQQMESGQVYQHYHYMISDYLNAFSYAGLTLKKTIEPNGNQISPDIGMNDHTPTFLVMQYEK